MTTYIIIIHYKFIRSHTLYKTVKWGIARNILFHNTMNNLHFTKNAKVSIVNT